MYQIVGVTLNREKKDTLVIHCRRWGEPETQSDPKKVQKFDHYEKLQNPKTCSTRSWFQFKETLCENLVGPDEETLWVIDIN